MRQFFLIRLSIKLQEIMNDIAPAKIEDIYMTIKLTKRHTITPLGIVRDVEVLCGQ